MTATGHRTRASHRLILGVAMAMLTAVAGLVCAQASAGDVSTRPAAHSVTTNSTYAQADDSLSTSATAPPTCSGTSEQPVEAPVSTRQEAPTPTPVTGPTMLPVPETGDAAVVPGRGGPAPPPSPPSYEELSVLRV